MSHCSELLVFVPLISTLFGDYLRQYLRLGLEVTESGSQLLYSSD